MEPAPAHAITKASVSGYRLDSGTRSMNLKYLLQILQFCKIEPTPGKKMKNLYARCFGRPKCGVISVLCSGRTRCCKPGVPKLLLCSHLRISPKKLLYKEHKF